MALTVDVHRTKDATVLRIAGRIVAGDEVTQIEQHVSSALKESLELVLNLGNVNYVDSSGLGALVRQVTAARARKKRITLCALTPNVTKLLQMTRVIDLFQTYATEEEALAAHGAAPRIPALGSMSGTRVLCVDESLDLLAYLRTVLQAEGYQVLSSSNFPDAQLFLKSANVLVFGPNPVPCSEGSSVETLRKAAPQVPIVAVQPTSDAAAMAQQVVAQVKKATA